MRGIKRIIDGAGAGNREYRETAEAVQGGASGAGGKLKVRQGGSIWSRK